RLGKKGIIAETGAGQHGVATATVCAQYGLECIISMGAQDMERQALNVFRMRLLGAEVRGVHSGTATLKDATSEAIKDWVTNVETTHYILGSVAGPHPYPMMVRDFHAVIGKETRRQALEKWGGKPDVLVACVGGGSNAMGLFHEFVDYAEVRVIGVEAAGFGLDSGKHAAPLTKGDVGVLHGAMSYLLQDDDGQIIEPQLDYPGVGPEHSFFKDMGWAEYYSVTGEEALEAIKDWVTNVETTHYILGSVAGPHPYPMMVRDFHAVIGKETRRQALEKWGGKPDVLVACVGGGSNAMGLFHEFVDYAEVRVIGVEAAGFGLDSGKHAAPLTKGDVGVLHGAMSYLLQDDDGQIIEPQLDYPGVGPEHSFFKDMGWAEYYSVTGEEALEALETSHALAHLEKLCPTLPDGARVVLNFSRRGDKDDQTVAKYLEV
ncbi:hypothetical protein DY000_02047191, partial [Brassica cretica]